MKNHLMIDLETLGTDPDCPVISLGAVFFGKEGLGETFEINLDTALQIDDGRRPSGDTIKWWMSQSDAAQKVFSEKSVDPKVALKKFKDFVVSNCDIKKVKPWGRGASFDIPILEDMFKQYRLEVPWLFWNIRCHRTFTEEVFSGKGIKREGVYHNALDDAIHQANIVIEGWRRTK